MLEQVATAASATLASAITLATVDSLGLTTEGLQSVLAGGKIWLGF